MTTRCFPLKFSVDQLLPKCLIRASGKILYRIYYNNWPTCKANGHFRMIVKKIVETFDKNNKVWINGFFRGLFERKALIRTTLHANYLQLCSSRYRGAIKYCVFRRF